ncbi:VWA domain-containing protein [Desulfovibrio sp. UIB00]|uniref:cobaltochelatase CobT-related protein n=1 Tax=Desulfovibrio sp. UIB00 TaxID=2804314 RepID=UPI001F0F3F54|nr:VWA domain-containing protein [Desulfovibrio sp. UIB00]MCH5144479.1 VWA domain-containing protein [Desulfovibrio sp. UIB00]
MIRTKDVLNCLPLLASILGDRYDVQVRIGGKEACTNGKVIHLPSLPIDCEPELLALAKGFTDHEAAHIRHTDFSVLKAANLNPVTFNLFNCLEDWRVEKKLSGIFPGCRRNLNWLILRFFVEQAQPRAGDDSPALAVLDYVLLTVRAWDVDEVTPARQYAASIMEHHFPGLKEALDAIMVKAYIHCPDTKAAIEYAKQIALCIRQWEPPQPIETNKCTSANNKKAVRQTTRETNDSTSQIDQQPESACTSAPVQQSRALNALPLKALFHAEAQDLPQNIGEIMSIELANSSAESSGDALTVAVEGTRHAAALPAEQKLQALQASIALRTRLQGFLQAQTQRRCSIGRRGTLHANSLYRLQVGNARVFQKESVQLGLNTAVHILLDVSGSMAGAPINLAKRACFAVTTALSRIRGVNPAVTAFPAATATNSVFPIMRHGQAVPDQFDILASGGTPLPGALWWVLQTMLPLKEQRKMILVITDGMPDNPLAANNAIGVAQKLGFEVYGLGIRDEHITHLLPHTSRVANDLPDLVPAMFALLQVALLKGGAA